KAPESVAEVVSLKPVLPMITSPPVVVIFPEALKVVNPDAAPAVDTSHELELMATVLLPPPIETAPLEVPVAIFTAKLEFALKLITPPLLLIPVVKFTVPLEVIPVKPEATPAEEISQSLELMNTSSPPSPMFAVPAIAMVVPLSRVKVQI